jgi:hypothetical protein
MTLIQMYKNQHENKSLILFSLFLSLAISTAMTNILLFFVIFWVLINKRKPLFNSIKTVTRPTEKDLGFYLVTLLWIVLILTAIAWTWALIVHGRNELEEVWKYRKILYVFLFAGLMVAYSVTPGQLIREFSRAMLVLAVLVLLNKNGLFDIFLHEDGQRYIEIGGDIVLNLGSNTSPNIGRNYITQSFFLALAFILCLSEQIRNFGHKVDDRFLWGSSSTYYIVKLILVGLACVSLPSRTGLILGLSGLFIAFFLTIYLNRNEKIYVKLKTPGFMTLVLLIFSIFFYWKEPESLKRVIETVGVNQTYGEESGAQPSRGLLHDGRYGFVRDGIKFFFENPLGQGLGAFGMISESKLNRGDGVLLPASEATKNPHSYVIYVMVSTGVVGLFIYLAITYMVTIGVLTNRTPCGVTTALFLANTLLFMNGFINNVLYDFAEGHLYAAFVAATLVQINSRVRQV